MRLLTNSLTWLLITKLSPLFTTKFARKIGSAIFIQISGNGNVSFDITKKKLHPLRGDFFSYNNFIIIIIIIIIII